MKNMPKAYQVVISLIVALAVGGFLFTREQDPLGASGLAVAPADGTFLAGGKYTVSTGSACKLTPGTVVPIGQFQSLGGPGYPFVYQTSYAGCDDGDGYVRYPTALAMDVLIDFGAPLVLGLLAIWGLRRTRPEK